MYEYLALTDGTTLLDLTDTIHYALVSYAPVVAPLRDNELGGGDGPYADAQETITINAIGCTAAEAYAAARAVNDLLDQARRWWKGDGVTAVRLLVKAQGSALDPLSVIVKGRAQGAPSNLALPAMWNEYHQRYVIQGITIQFVRRARLLSLTTDTATVAAAAVPTVMTATFATTHNQLSPLKVDFTGAPGVASSTIIIAVTPNTGQVIIEAESGVPVGSFTSVADAANSPRGAAVARYTAPAIPLAETLTVTIAGLNSSARRFVIIAAVRKNTAADVFDVSFSFRKVSGAVAAILTTTETQRISGSNTNPQLLIFDPASMKDQPNSLVLNLNPISTVAARTFDIDYIAVIQVDDNASTILTVAWPSLGANETIEVDPLILEPTPRVQLTDTGVNFAMTYLGDPAAFGVRGSQVQCAVYATGGSGTPTKWRMWDGAAVAVAQLGLSLTRQKAYLIAE